jgi:hypothetical protein
MTHYTRQRKDIITNDVMYAEGVIESVAMETLSIFVIFDLIVSSA